MKSVFKKALDYLTGKKELQDQLNRIEQKVDDKPKNQEEKVCRNKIIYSVNTKNLTVITCDGDTFEAFNVEQDLISQLRDADNETIIRLLSPKVEVKPEEYNVEQEEKELVSNFLDIFEGIDDFEVLGNSVYFKGIRSVEIPSLIVARFVELLQKRRDTEVDVMTLEKDFEDLDIIDTEYQTLKAFTLKLLLNPLQESRENALNFVRNFDIKMTNTGNLIMYRRIVAKSNSNKELIEFVSKQYLKVKSWKKSPKNYAVGLRTNGYELTKIALEDKDFKWEDIKHAFIGNLADLYNNLSELKENRYTDDYTRSYDIRIGATYKINEEDIDLNKNGSCGGALHVADGKKFNYSGFGNTPVVCIINPMHIYKMDSGHSGKIGVRQMFIAAITTQNEDGNYEDIDSQDLVNFDEMYHTESIEELTQALQSKSLDATSVSTAMSEVSLKDVENITSLLKNRIITV